MRQKYEGDPRTRSRMAQELKKLNEGTENLALEEEGWLPIEAAAGLTTGDVTENAAFTYWLGDYLSEELPARLDQRQLDILLLHGLDGLTYEEIGKIMGYLVRGRIIL